MKISDWLTALAAALAAVFLVPVSAVAAPDLIDVCHKTADAGPDADEWLHLQVNANSLEGHMLHGDAQPGDAVPATLGALVFDDDCDPQTAGSTSPPDPDGSPEPPTPPESSELIFAVAYSDMDPNDGGYNPELDVLIAKLIDGPDDADDGVPGVGDLIITDQYPEDFGISAFGIFGLVEPRSVTELVSGLDYRCVVETGVGTFIWSSGQGNFDLYQEWNSLASAKVYDDRSLATIQEDEIKIALGSPSQPSSVVALSGSDLNDQVFIDVEADCLP